MSCTSASLVDEPWRIESRRIIAIIGTPAEVLPGTSVSLRAIVATPSGEVTTAPVAWSRCETPRPPTQNAAVADECVVAAAQASPGDTTVTLDVSPRACALFGTGVTNATDRPRDADPTGGWYQPFGAVLDDEVTFAFERLRCEPAGISLDVAREYAARWRPNTNPAVELDAQQSGTTVTLRARSPATPEERYVRIDSVTLLLDEVREAYRVSWFTTAGTLSSAHGDEVVLELAAAEATVWAVLRDGRGGAAVAARRFSPP